VSASLKEQPKSIKTLSHLIHSNLKLGAQDIVYNRDYFRRATDPETRRLYATKILVNNQANFFNVSQGMAQVKRGGFAFQVASNTAYKIIADTFSEREVCELSQVRMISNQVTFAVVQKGSPFRKVVAYGLRRLAETGVMERQRRIFHARKPICVREIQPSDLKVDWGTTSFAFGLLLAGCFGSLAILACEIFVFRFFFQNGRIR
jgi:hypothetical protein